MQLSIITPEKILFSATATQVQVPGTLGDFGVLPGHAPFISTIRPGVIVIDTNEGTQRRIAITGGIAEANPEACTILAESAEECTSWGASEIEAKKQAALELQAEAETEAQAETAEKKLALAHALSDAAR
ncbi:MAG: ATP synthase F1 subunit epsilon [Rickettsiales bacterium]|nr:ATP synthase F1 subunit epsilon [Rickettsiales bacterium]